MGNPSHSARDSLFSILGIIGSHENAAEPLSSAFELVASEPWVAQHNREVREVWSSFKADKPVRVPVIYSGARIAYLEENQIDYRTYYENPEEMLRMQLEWQKREGELPLGDTILAETPDSWQVWVDFHPVASASCFGCPVKFREGSVPAHECAHLSRKECRDMPMPDLFSCGLLPRQRQFQLDMDRLLGSGLHFLGKPVKRLKPNLPSPGGGIFSSALDIRGPDIMIDMYEDPAFVHDFLERITEWQFSLHRAWCAADNMPCMLDNPDGPGIDITDHGIDLLSPELYDEFLVSLILKLCTKYGKRPSTFLHHCGQGTHLFPIMKERFGITDMHALTWPLNDVGRIRREIGEEIWITAAISDSILNKTPESIHKAVQDFLTPEVMGRGRLSIWVPGEVTGIPIENYCALYSAVREFGNC